MQGGFDDAAAASVAGPVSELLDRLIDGNLVELHPSRPEGSEARRARPRQGLYSLHPVIRAFAAARLAEAADAEEVHDGHAAWVLGRFSPGLRLLRGAQRREAFEEVIDILGDIEIAWQRALHARDVALLAAATPALHQVLAWAGLGSAGGAPRPRRSAA